MKKIGRYMLLFLVLVGIIWIAPSFIYHYILVGTHSYCIEDKDRIVDTTTEKGSKYLIYTDVEVLENTDTWYYIKYNSSDVYNDLKIGKCYDLKVYGMRIPFLSWYKNIVKIKAEVPSQVSENENIQLSTSWSLREDL